MNAITRWSPEESALLSQCGVDVQRAPRDQIAAFLAIAKRSGLDPVSKQVELICFKDKWMVYVRIDGARRIADQTGCYAPGVATYTYDDGRLVGCTVTVRKRTPDGTWHDVPGDAWMDEDAGRSPVWQSRPRTMLAKVAEMRALRKAFPSHIGGMYAREEMDAPEHTEPSATAPVALPAPAGPEFQVFDALAMSKDTSGLPEAQARFIRDVTEDQWARIARQPGGPAKLQGVMDALHGCPEVQR